MMKRTLPGVFFCLAVTLIGVAGEPFYTGQVLPKPQQVLGEWVSVPVSVDRFEIVLDDPANKTLILAKKFLLERATQTVGEKKASVAGQKVVVLLGLFDSEAIKAADQKYKLKFSDLVLPAEGYALRVVRDKDQVAVIAAGVDRRGAFYAAATLRQQIGLVDGKPILRIADLNDWPDWPHRYASDYNPYGRGAMEFLALNKINGFAIQHRYEWHDFNADTPQNWGRIGTYGEVLKTLKDFRDETGLIDYMLVMNIYADRKQAWFDITNEQDIRGLIERCKYAAASGITHVMICVDDWTPNENGRYVCPYPAERKKFGDSVGKAHGYLMTRLFNDLKKAYPDFELSIVPPVYSLLDHKAADPHSARYLRELSANLPEEVYVVWTGPRVVSNAISRQDYLAFSRLINHHRLMLWDNSECINLPMPHWITQFYDGFAADSQGMIFLNVHGFSWPWVIPFDLTINDYLWNPKGYDPAYSYRNAVEKMFGPATYPPVRAFIEKYEALQKATDKETKITLIRELEQLIKEFEKKNLPTQHPAGAVKAVKAEVTVKVPTLTIPRLTAAPNLDGNLDDPAWAATAAFQFSADPEGIKGKEYQPGRGKIGFDDTNLYIGFIFYYQKPLAVPNYKDTHDDAVYNSPDAVEIFLQPDPKGSYGHFVVDYLGNYFDEKDGGGAGSWDPEWTIRITKEKKQWTAEIAIPLTTLQQLAPGLLLAGGEWKGNVCRVYNADGQVSAWSVPYGSFHNPLFWGVLKFGK